MASLLFYLLAATALLATLLCITRRSPVHAVIFLINAFFALALMFYLLGAPLIAAWEVIVYAGAIMVLFLFVIMTLELKPDAHRAPLSRRQWAPALLLFLLLLVSAGLILTFDPAGQAGVPLFYAPPRSFGAALFNRYGLAVEIVSFQLLFAAAGAYYLGRRRKARQPEESS
jgi:NADH-quinone oxidoreductase subunit J